MKKYIIILVAILSILPIYAQNNNVKLFEFEAGLGISSSVKYPNYYYAGDYDKTIIGSNMLIEARINIPNSAFDVGAQLNLSYFARKWNDFQNVTYRYTNFAVYSDYNYRKWKHLSLFAGFGFGFSYLDEEHEYVNTEWGRDVVTGYYRPFYINPRIGVELFNHARVTFDYKIMRAPFSNFNFTLGIVLGGGIK